MIAAYTNLKINAIFTNSTALYSIVQTVLQPHHLTFVSQSVIIAPTLTVEKNVESACCAHSLSLPLCLVFRLFHRHRRRLHLSHFIRVSSAMYLFSRSVLRSLAKSTRRTNNNKQYTRKTYDDNALSRDAKSKTAVTTNKESMNVLLLTDVDASQTRGEALKFILQS